MPEQSMNEDVNLWHLAAILVIMAVLMSTILFDNAIANTLFIVTWVAGVYFASIHAVNLALIGIGKLGAASE